MRHGLPLALICALALSACGPDIPALEDRGAGTPGASGYPDLVPLGPLLDRVDTLPATEAAPEGRTLEDRGAELRLRAARLRAMPL